MSPDHALVFMPRPGDICFTAHLGNLHNHNNNNFSEFRYFIKTGNAVISSYLHIHNYPLPLPKVPRIYVRIPGNNTILVGLLDYYDGYLPDWVEWEIINIWAETKFLDLMKEQCCYVNHVWFPNKNIIVWKWLLHNSF